MNLPISRSMLAALLLSAVMAVIAVLMPEPLPAPDDSLLANPRSGPAPEVGRQARGRQLQSPPLALLQRQGFMVPPPPPPPVLSLPTPVLVPLRPPVPEPGFRYVGRMVQDGSVQVFLAQGDDVDVVRVGELVGSSWRIEAVDESGVELRYLPLNETRRLALSNN